MSVTILGIGLPAGSPPSTLSSIFGGGGGAGLTGGDFSCTIGDVFARLTGGLALLGGSCGGDSTVGSV